jgi:hypothetical protein
MEYPAVMDVGMVEAGLMPHLPTGGMAVRLEVVVAAVRTMLVRGVMVALGKEAKSESLVGR